MTPPSPVPESVELNEIQPTFDDQAQPVSGDGIEDARAITEKEPIDNAKTSKAPHRRCFFIPLFYLGIDKAATRGWG